MKKRLNIATMDTRENADTPSSRARMFHVTVLSNFARAYDRYARAYCKDRIPESTYPNEFYVLAPEDLAIGVSKASKLRARLGLANNELIAIEAALPAELCLPNVRNGLGSVWPSSNLPVANVWRVDDEGAIAPLTLEEAMAKSLALHESTFHSYETLVPRSVSLLPIARGCQAACPFCFSEASASADQKQARVDWGAIRGWTRLAKARGAERAVITGGGEPTMLPFTDLTRLVEICRSEFAKVVIITNGVKFAMMSEEEASEHLVVLKSAGLQVLAVSRHHPDEQRNARLMNLETHTPRLMTAIRDGADRLSGLRVRLICVLQQGGVESVRGIDEYVRWASASGAVEVCFKELYVSTTEESVYHSHAANAWSAAHQVPLSLVLTWAKENGFVRERELPWGAPVFRGTVAGRPIRVAAYTEPSLFWERTHGISRSWNVMADGSCVASLEDRKSTIVADHDLRLAREVVAHREEKRGARGVQ